jgi:hypothetical protein
MSKRQSTAEYRANWRHVDGDHNAAYGVSGKIIMLNAEWGEAKRRFYADLRWIAHRKPRPIDNPRSQSWNQRNGQR